MIISIVFGTGYALKYMILGREHTLLTKLAIDSILLMATGYTYLNLFGVEAYYQASYPIIK